MHHLHEKIFLFSILRLTIRQNFLGHSRIDDRHPVCRPPVGWNNMLCGLILFLANEKDTQSTWQKKSAHSGDAVDRRSKIVWDRWLPVPFELVSSFMPELYLSKIGLPASQVCRIRPEKAIRQRAPEWRSESTRWRIWSAKMRPNWTRAEGETY